MQFAMELCPNRAVASAQDLLNSMGAAPSPILCTDPWLQLPEPECLYLASVNGDIYIIYAIASQAARVE